MGCRTRQIFSWVLLLGAIVLGLLLGLRMLNSPSAMAAIQRIEEAPGQVVYQARQTLKDQHGNSWQAIAFKRIGANGQTHFNLRLVGFPGVVEINHSQPLTLTNSLGTTLTANEDLSGLLTEATKSGLNVGQYNLQPVLSELRTELPLKIILPTLGDESVVLPVSPALVQEWQSLATNR